MAPKTKTSIGPSLVTQLTYNQYSSSSKVSESGLDFFWSGGILGALSSAVLVAKHKPILICNTANALAYVAFGGSSVAAPASAAAGVMLAPYGSIILSSGENTYVRASAATVFGFVANDDVTGD